MFTHQERMKAIELLLQYDISHATVRRELGYPAKTTLINWYNEYKKNGRLREEYTRKSKYSLEKKQKANNYYLTHGKCISRTIRALGYPCRQALDNWIKKLSPNEKKHCRSGGSLIKYTRDQKEQAVVALCSRSKPAKEIASDIGVTREALYNWKHQLLSRDGSDARIKIGQPK